MVTGDHSNGPTAIDELLWLPNTITCLKESLTSRGLSKVRPSGLGSAQLSWSRLRRGRTNYNSHPRGEVHIHQWHTLTLQVSSRPFHTQINILLTLTSLSLPGTSADSRLTVSQPYMPYNQINSITECIYEQNSKYNDKTNKNIFLGCSNMCPRIGSEHVHPDC